MGWAFALEKIIAISKGAGVSLVNRPQGYQGINHETIGLDILAVLGSLMIPEAVLGDEMVTKLRAGADHCLFVIDAPAISALWG